jgi:prepilin-type N-terminal cleavage/methylation domain-containing protein
MNKIFKNEHGFSAVEVIMVLVIVGLICAVGFLVYKNHNKATTVSAVNTTKTTTTTPTKNAANPYAGWTTYTLKYEKASFKYPSSWQLKDSSFADSKTTGGGADVIKLTGSNGFEMSIADGGPNDYGFPLGGLTSVSTDPVTFFSQQAYMNLAEAGASNTGVVDYINLTSTKTSLTDFPTDKNVVAPTYQGGTTENKFLILMDYNANVDTSSANPTYPHTSLTTVQKDTNYLEAKLIVSSFTY